MMFNIILLSWCVLAFTYGQRMTIPRYYVKPTSLQCYPNYEWVTNVTCILKPINWERTLTNMSVEIIKPMRNVSVHMQFFRRETHYVPFLVNVTKNVCDLLRNKGVNFYSKVVMDIVRTFTQNEFKCPFLGHVGITNLYVDGKYISFAVPTGSYKVVFEVFEGYPLKSAGIFFFQGTVEETLKVANRKKG